MFCLKLAQHIAERRLLRWGDRLPQFLGRLKGIHGKTRETSLFCHIAWPDVLSRPASPGARNIGAIAMPRRCTLPASSETLHGLLRWRRGIACSFLKPYVLV